MITFDWDVSFDYDTQRDVIMIDTGDDVLTLTREELLEMLSALGDQ